DPLTTGGGKARNHQALQDWGPRDWQWGAVQLVLATALPHLAVHQEKRHLWVSEEVLGDVQKGSVNCSKGAYVFPSPLFAFLDQVKEGGWKPPRCRQLTNLPPLVALLRPFAAGDVALDAEEGAYAVVAGWIPLGPLPADSARLLLGLRRRLEDAVVESAEMISQQGAAAFAAGGGQVDPELAALLRELLRPGQMRSTAQQAIAGSSRGAKGLAMGAKGGALGPAKGSHLVQPAGNWKGAGSWKGKW
ncbi:unnamed protein product, partial [Polarella glacialis]